MEGRTRLYVASATLWGLGFALLYFASGTHSMYAMPLYALAAAPLLAVVYMARGPRLGSKLAGLSYLASFFASLPVFYIAGRILYDELRSNGKVPPALVGIYEAFPAQFPYFLTIFLFAVFLASMAFYRAFEDFFERIAIIEKFRGVNYFLEARASGWDLVGAVLGAAITFISVKAGYTYIVLLPFLYFSKIQVLLAAALSSTLISVFGANIDIVGSLTAAAVYYVLEASLFSRYAGQIVVNVRRPMRVFLTSISLLMTLIVFFTLFQVQAPIIAASYMLLALPILISLSTLEVGALSLPLGVAIAVGAGLGREVGGFIGVDGGIVQVLAYMFASTILAAQVSSYSTLMTTGEETEECYIGLMEGVAALFAAVIATWYYGVRETTFNFTGFLRGGSFTLAGLALPAAALGVSVVHMVFATPLVSEGLWLAAINPFDPLGILLGCFFPSPVFSATAVSAIVLKLVNARSGKLTPIMRGFTYGMSVAAILLSVAV